MGENAVTYQQQQYVPPPPPPKKRMSKEAKIGFWILGGLIALILVLAPFASTTTDSPSSVADKPAAGKKISGVACADQEVRTDPCPVAVGKPFQLGRHAVLAGWTVSENSLGWVEMTGKAQNVSDRTSSMLIEVKFLNGNEVVMDLQCTTDQLDPGQVQAITCLSGDDFTAQYTRVTAQAGF